MTTSPQPKKCCPLCEIGEPTNTIPCGDFFCPCHTSPSDSSGVDGWEEALMDLAAVNYNLYFGSPAERADRTDGEGDKIKWSFDEAIAELKSFIRTLTDSVRREEREALAEKVREYQGPGECKEHPEGKADCEECTIRFAVNKTCDAILAEITNNSDQ